MKTVKVNVYKYEELNDKAKQKVKDNYFNECYFLDENLTDSARFLLNEKGFKVNDIKLNYSLGYSQGDGVAFNLSLMDDEGNSYYVKNDNGSYSHYNSMTYEKINSDGEDVDCEQEFIDFIKDLSRKIEQEGYNDIEYERSDENVKENCEINDFWFFEDGRLYVEKQRK